ncbi:MAG: hypothetical protein M1514_00395, partial [Patescibacteria group bacterium]|nr:hypothetical protein [Patescibacteria group bacterium]
SLKLGNIYSKDKPETAGPKTPSVSIIMEATGDSKNLIKFSDELHKTLPLAEVKKMGTAQSRGTYEVNFFYKPYNLNALARQEVVNSISPAQINLLKTLEEWLKNSK